MVRFNLSDYLLSMYCYDASSFSGSMWFMPFYSTYGLSFDPLGIGYRAVNVFDSCWVEYFGGQGL
jgi:NADH-ubiquinone oxidoreductase chain 5